MILYILRDKLHSQCHSWPATSVLRHQLQAVTPEVVGQSKRPLGTGPQCLP